MAFEFKFPDVGEGITEGEVVKWLVKEGDLVKSDQTIAQIETDKSVADIPSPKSGTILKIHVKEGETIKVGETLVTIGDKDENVSSTKEKKENISKKVKKLKKELKRVPKVSKSGSVVGELEEATDEQEIKFHSESRKPEEKILTSPKIRRLAKDKNIDLKKIQGTGPKGRILKKDLIKEGVPEKIPEQKVLVKKKYDDYGYLERIPLKGVRKAIARNVKESQDRIAEVTAMFDIDITKLWKIREKEKKSLALKGIKLTLLPFIIKACIAAMKEHPILNSSIEGEEIIIKKYFNIGIAADTEVGLMVPVIKIAENKNIEKLAKEIVELAEKSRTRKIDLMDLKGSTFTITNYGSIGGKYATPIINENNAAILGIGRVFDNLVIKKGMTVSRKILPLSLTFDHRILDGAEASYFMETLRKYLEDPDNLLIKS